MIEHQLRLRGVRDERVLAAMSEVPREAFLPPEYADAAYDDRPLPIAGGQTISQPYIVAVMAEAAALRPEDRVLEIGTGSGYAAAVLAKVVRHVDTIERLGPLATTAAARLVELGFTNVEVRHDDGTLGWPEHAPYDAIVVAAGGPTVPDALREQLAIGGRLVIPVGSDRGQELVRVTRTAHDTYTQEELGPVVFVPLIGRLGWPVPRAQRTSSVAKLIAECAEPISSIEDAAIDGLLERIGDARIVLLGESTHGTSEFYRMRTRITQQLILRHGFTAIAVEADWPDAAVVDRYVNDEHGPARSWAPFTRFPTWMWRNTETRDLVEWLRAYNAETDRRVTFAGLDLYSLYTSAYEVMRYLDRVDPPAAMVARQRYGRLTPWQHDPAAYGHAVLLDRMRSCERDVLAILRALLAQRLAYASEDGDAFFDAAQNARVVADAEHYYRAMYYGTVESWNLRDRHMFETLRALRAHRGDAKLIVWEHNSHVGDASATEMAARGEHNVGQLCREAYGEQLYVIGFGTDHGTVAAAHQWDEPMHRMSVRPARTASYEALCHDSGVPAFMLHLRTPWRRALRDELANPRLERAIGVIYRPETELESHYFQAVLPDQFDEYVWFDESNAIHPLGEPAMPRAAGAHPLVW